MLYAAGKMQSAAEAGANTVRCARISCRLRPVGRSFSPCRKQEMNRPYPKDEHKKHEPTALRPYGATGKPRRSVR